jgi:PAS domain S-box-containing protein
VGGADGPAGRATEEGGGDAPGGSRGRQEDDDLRLLADSARDFAMIFTDPERRVVRWSAGAEAVLGWTEAEAVGANEKDLIFTPEDRAAGVPDREQEAALRDGRADDDRWHMRKDGTRFWASGVMVPLYDPETHGLRGFGKVLRDQTVQKRAEEALGASEGRKREEAEYLSFVLGTLGAAEYEMNVRTGALRPSPRLNELYGFPPEHPLTLEECRARYHPDDRAAMASILPDAVERGERRFERELRIVVPGRGVRWLLSRGEVLFGPGGGGPERVRGAAFDITARKRAEEALRASEARLQRSFSIDTVGVIFFDLAGTIRDANDAFLRMGGYSREDLAAGRLRWDELTPPEFREVTLLSRQELLTRGENTPYEKQYRRPDGTRWWGRFAGKRLSDDECVEFVLDVTEARQAEADLRESEERLSAIFSRAAVGLSEVSLDGRFLRVNDELCRLLGRTREELLTLGIPEVTHPDSQAETREAVARAAASGGPASLEKRYVRPDGSEVWANSSATLLRDDQGSPRAFLVVTTDLTERKRYEDWLLRANELLEERVADRTAALAAMNRELEQRSESLTAALTALEAALEEQRRAEGERRELTRRVVVAQEEERRRISRELHDQMGQLLTGFSLALKSLEGAVGEHCPDESGAAGTLGRLRALAADMGREVHRIAVELRPTALDDLGLVPALAAYVEEWGERTGARAEFAALGLVGGHEDRLPSLVETTVYRVVQEALNNAAKYAVTGGPGGATHVSVLLQRVDDGRVLQATVEDDGPGFDAAGVSSGDAIPAPRAPAGRPRLGLLGMRERAGLAGGALQVERAPGEGVTVILRVPITPA